MIKGWRECKLGDVAEIKTGKSNAQDSILGGIYPLFDRSQSIKQSNRFLFDDEAIIVAGEGKVFTPRYFNGKFDLHQRVYAIHKITKAIPKFIFYAIWSNKKYFESVAVGSTVMSLRLNHFTDFPLLLPPLQEQKAIAEILSSLDDKIDLLHRQNQTLESIAQTLFRQWFIQDAKETRMGKISDWIEDTIGGDWGKENPTDDFNIPTYCIRGTDIADLNNGLPSRTPVRFIKQKKLENIEPKEGDIILEISGGTEGQSTGRTTYINDEIKKLFKYPIVFSNFCRLIRVKKKEYSYFIYLYLQHLYANDEFFGLENGSSGIKNLNYKVLLNDLEYQMPNESQVIKFDSNIKDYFIKINQNKKQIQTLENLRDTLLPKLISGEVRIAI